MNSSIITDAFDVMGGDPSNAVSAAKNFSSVNSWTAWQASQAAVAGAGALAVPGAHVPAMVADVAFLMHKMAYCSWGIGGIYDCSVEGKPDFAIILAHWAGEVSEDALGGAIVTGTVAGSMALAGSPAVVGKLLGKGVGLGVTELTAKAGLKASSKTIGKVSGKLVEKAAAKLATKIGTKISAKGIAGFVPIIGPAVGGSVNVYFVKSISNSAEAFYSKKWQIEEAAEAAVETE